MFQRSWDGQVLCNMMLQCRNDGHCTAMMICNDGHCTAMMICNDGLCTAMMVCNDGQLKAMGVCNDGHCTEMWHDARSTRGTLKQARQSWEGRKGPHVPLPLVAFL
eukprot:1141536-Pelagomonas_calceolata.AAC.4